MQLLHPSSVEGDQWFLPPPPPSISHLLSRATLCRFVARISLNAAAAGNADHLPRGEEEEVFGSSTVANKRSAIKNKNRFGESVKLEDKQKSIISSTSFPARVEDGYADDLLLHRSIFFDSSRGVSGEPPRQKATQEIMADDDYEARQEMFSYFFFFFYNALYLQRDSTSLD